MEFKEFLDLVSDIEASEHALEEALYREPGSFASKLFKPSTEPSLNPQNDRMNNRFASYDQRVNYGKGIEKQIFDSLVKCGLQLREPKSQEDMYDKVDAWWTRNGKEEGLQIKYRDTGRDVLFEVMKDFNRKIPGRDMVGRSKFYAVLVKNSSLISIVEVEEAKKLINAALKTVEKVGFDQQDSFNAGNLILKVRPDPKTGIKKLMAYIPVTALKNVMPPCMAKVSF